MNTTPNPSQPPNEIDTAAAQWVLRCDRGLTAAEQDEFSSWLAANPKHGEALAEQRWGWDELDRLAGLQTSIGAIPNPDLLAPRRRRASVVIRSARWWAPLTLAAAAAVVIGLRQISPDAPAVAPRAEPAPLTALAAPCERRTLEDGSTVALNRGAAIEIAFSGTERRVRLVRGEANFTVAKDPARPFVVVAGGVAVRAIGTEFNVRLDAASVEVLVSEGKVQVESPAAAPKPALVTERQRVIVPLGASGSVPAEVESLTTAEVEARLLWQPRLLDFTDAPLPEILAAFNRRNPVRLVVADPALETVRLSVAFRSDNVEGFVRLMESDFGMRADWRGEREIALRRAK